MRQFGVAFVGDDELPEGKDWLVLVVGQRVLMCVRASKVCPQVIADAWASFRRVDGEQGARSFHLAS